MPRLRIKQHRGPSVFRPVEFDQAIADSICTQLCEGKTLETIISSKKMPTRLTVFRWMNHHPTFTEQYERAQRLAADAIAERAHDRALSVKNADDVQVVSLGLKSSQWMAGKLSPRWADKVAVNAKHEVSGPNGGPIEIHTMLDVFLAPTNIELLSDAELDALEVLRSAAKRLAAPAASTAAGVVDGVEYAEVPTDDGDDA